MRNIKAYPFSFGFFPSIQQFQPAPPIVDIIIDDQTEALTLIYEKYGLKCYSKSRAFLSGADLAFSQDWKNLYTSEKYLHEVVEYADKFIKLNKKLFDREIAKERINKL
jgi:hypothetical protein